jgi:hypothetical protein
MSDDCVDGVKMTATVILQVVSEACNATTNNYLKALKVPRFLLRSHQQPVRKRGVERVL